MRVLLLTILLASFSSYAVETKEVKEAVVSCIRVVASGEDYHDVEPELFFWSQVIEANVARIREQGYRLKETIYSNVLCGGYTPIIEVNSRNRFKIISAINSYRPVIEDGHRVWVTDLVFER